MNKTNLSVMHRQLRDLLRHTVEHFRRGEDRCGLDAFLSAIDDMNDIIQLYILTEEFSMIEETLPLLRRLLEALCNEDITGVVDILEFSYLPFAEKVIEGVEEA